MNLAGLYVITRTLNAMCWYAARLIDRYALVSRSELMEENAAQVFITMMFTCPLLPCSKMLSPFRENNIVVVFPYPFHIFMLLANLWIIRFQG